MRGSYQKVCATDEERRADTSNLVLTGNNGNDGHDTFAQDRLDGAADWRVLCDNDIVLNGEEISTLAVRPKKVQALHAGYAVDAILLLLPKGFEDFHR